MAAPKHIHKYRRDTLGSKGYVIYKCVLPFCQHYLAENLVKGKLSICWRCGEPFIMKELHAKPHCEACVRKRKELDSDVADITTKLLGGS